jgi:hypothetical protein
MTAGSIPAEVAQRPARFFRGRLGLPARPGPISYLLVFLFFAYCSYCLPFGGDDWNWASQFGSTFFSDGIYRHYDGRYLADLLIIVMTRSLLARITIFAGVCTLLVFLMNRSLPRPRMPIFLLSCLLILGVPATIFSQVFGWNSGFVNYIPSLLLPLFYLSTMRRHLVREKAEPATHGAAVTSALLMAPLALLGQLFVEHVTAYNLFLGMAVLVVSLRARAGIVPAQISYMVFSVAGAALMFSCTAYGRILGGNDSYRHYRSITQSLTETLSATSAKVARLLLLDNTILVLFMGLAGILILFAFKTRPNSRLSARALVPLAVFAGYPLCAPIALPLLGLRLPGSLSLLLSVVFLGGLGYASISCLRGPIRTEVLFHLLSALLLGLPFLVVSPFGPRTFFAAYVFLSLFVLRIVDGATRADEGGTMESARLSALLGVAVLVLSCHYLVVFSEIRVAKEMRAVLVQRQVSQGRRGTIDVLELPHARYAYATQARARDLNFRAYLGIPEGLRMRYVQYREWGSLYRQSESREAFLSRYTE